MWKGQGMFGDLSLSPALATVVFVAGVVAGYNYRRNWKEEGPAWKTWVYGLVAALAFMTVAFIPLSGR